MLGISALPEKISEEVGGNCQPWLKGFPALRLLLLMRDAGLRTSTTPLRGTGQHISRLVGTAAASYRHEAAQRPTAVSNGYYSEGFRATSGNIRLNTSPLILSGSSFGDSFGWFTPLSAEGTASGGLNFLSNH